MVQEKMQEYSKIAAFLTNQLTSFFCKRLAFNNLQNCFFANVKIKIDKKKTQKSPICVLRNCQFVLLSLSLILPMKKSWN